MKRSIAKKSIAKLNGVLIVIQCLKQALRETVKDREAGHAAVHGVTSNWTLPSD